MRSVRPASITLASLVVTALVSPASAQCARWQPGHEIPGMFGGALALAAHDDGSGSKLYAGGSIRSAGRRPVLNLVRWNGLEWETFGGQGPDNFVWDLETFDDGSGPALFVAGQFTLIGGISAGHIARWDGATWSGVGGGTSGVIYALQPFDDGSGPALYAAGSFFDAGGLQASSIARWNGSSWSALGAGITPLNVSCLAVFDDGAGPALYAGGFFNTAGGVPAQNIARWQGGTWSPVPGGANLEVRALCVHDDGSGPALYAGGSFTSIGGVSALRIARFRGGAWSAVGAGFGERITSLASFVDGGGARLYASGRFTNSGAAAVRRFARWDGSAWSQVGDGADFESYAFGAYDDGLGGGPALYVGTGSAGPAGSSGVARLAGQRLVTLTGGAALYSTSGVVTTTSRVVFDDTSGSGPELYVAGTFDVAGTARVNGLALWNGWRWRAFPGPAATVARELAVHDDGSGPALYAYGSLPVGGSTFEGIGRWSGASWTALGNAGITGTNFPRVNALLGHDDGSGPALYATGNFYTVGGVSAQHVARFRAGAWEPLGGGFNRPGAALAAFDDGTGLALYAGGTFFTASGVPVQAIARWRNGAWSALGAGLQQDATTAGSVSALCVHDDGSGPALYACGAFTLAGGAPASNIARWRNGVWTPLGTGLPSGAAALASHDDGSGPALYVAGTFQSAGGVPARAIARWNGVSWSALDGGIRGSVHELASYSGGLYALGGTLLDSGGIAASSIARWQAIEPRDCNANGVDDACDLRNGTSTDADLDGVPDECQPEPAETVCAGDGSSTTCPCGGVSAYGHGCANSQFPRGAVLTALGSARVGADTLRLVSGSMPNSSALYFQGTERALGASGAGVVLGDGLRCASGTVVRLGTKSNSGNASQYPAAGDPPVSVRGGVPPSGGRRVYQVWYRNAALGFCTAATSNLTNAVALDWAP